MRYLLLFLLFPFFAQAQQDEENIKYLPPAEFQIMITFPSKGDVIRENNNGLYALYNEEGKPLTLFIFSNIELIPQTNLYKVQIGDSYGIIDKNGNYKIKPQFIQKIVVHNNFIIVNSYNEVFIYDINLNLKYQYHTDKWVYFQLSIMQTGLLINSSNQHLFVGFNNFKTQLIGTFEKSDAYYLSSLHGNGSYFIAHNKGNSYVVHFVNESTINVSKPYDVIKRVGDGIFVVQKNGLWGLINKKDELIIDLVFHSISEVQSNSNILIVKNDNGFQLVAKSGTVITSTTYNSLVELSGHFLIQKKSKFSVLDKILFKEQFDFKYDTIFTINDFNLVAIQPNQFFIYDENYKLIHSYTGEFVINLNHHSFLYLKNKKYGICEKGMISEAFYDSYSIIKGPWYDILKLTKGKENEFKIIDKTVVNKIIVPTTTTEIEFVDNNYIIFKNQSKIGLYNIKMNQLLAPAAYDMILKVSSSKLGYDYLLKKGNQYYSLKMENEMPVINEISY